MVEMRQDPGKTEAGGLTPAPEDNLEHVLDAWSSEPGSRQRYDRLRLERRDGESLEVLLDAETARDLGDKLTIVAARARHRSRGAAGVAVDPALDAGAAEDLARARKVIALMPDVAWANSAGPKHIRYTDAELSALVDEFRASREDVTKAHAMIDEVHKRTREQLASGSLLLQSYAADIEALRAELESVKADRMNLIAEAAERDIEIEGCTCREIMAKDDTRHFRGCALREKFPTHPAEIDLTSDPSEKEFTGADLRVKSADAGSVTFAPEGEISWEEFKQTERAMKTAGLNPTNGEVFAEAERRRASSAG